MSKHNCSHDHTDFKDIKPNQVIGVFDSGVGGFSVYNEIKLATDMPVVYFGDTAYAPYGNKSEEFIRERIKKILLFLKQYGASYYVSACNSMSVLTTKQLLEEVGIPSEAYCDMVNLVDLIPFEKNAKVLIAGTVATINSLVYQELFSGKGLDCEVYAPKELAGAIESDNLELVKKEIHEVIEFAKRETCTHVLYACTHYPLVADVFTQVAKELSYQGEFVNPAKCVESKVPHAHDSISHQDVFVTTKNTEVFKKYSGNHTVFVYDL